MQLTHNTNIIAECDIGKPVEYALAALARDFSKVFVQDKVKGMDIILREEDNFQPECYRIEARDGGLFIFAGDSLGFVYAIYEVSRRFLGVQPFWFWNDQRFERVESVEIPDDFVYVSRPARVRWRGWFVNDETLIMNWSYERRREGPWEMVFEVLLRLGGNLVIPGTDSNSKRYKRLASDMGLVITHHHAEPMGAEMFVRAYPGYTPSFAKHPDLFRELWRKALIEQSGMPVIWNIGFRGQGDRPFWEDDPQYDTPKKRGMLMSGLIQEQYDMIKSFNSEALCCTNLYGEIMTLYKEGYLNLPEDVIKIWADNGFGKMVSRRQMNDNPRIPALPSQGDTGRNGLYYHASFYDLQAASHITALPNSAEFVHRELAEALSRGVGDYWVINCSNVKPHTYLLDFIAAMWRDGNVDVTEHRKAYAAAYYGEAHAFAVADCIAGYASHAISYGEHEDDHAGDQFYNHVPRMLISQFMMDRNKAADGLFWLAGETAPEEEITRREQTIAGEKQAIALRGQAAWVERRMLQAVESYQAYLRECESVCSRLSGAARSLFTDTVLLQARLYELWSRGGLAVCQSIDAAFAGDYKRAFYLAGCARQSYLLANRTMRDCEHGKWIDFYANECQTDVKQTAAVCGGFMSYLRNLGEGPYFYEWQREFGDSGEDRRIMLLLNTTNHPSDEELWRLMEQRYGA